MRGGQQLVVDIVPLVVTMVVGRATLVDEHVASTRLRTTVNNVNVMYNTSPTS